jgi:uncharacterized protein Veg
MPPFSAERKEKRGKNKKVSLVPTYASIFRLEKKEIRQQRVRISACIR